MANKAWILTIYTQDGYYQIAGASIDIPSACQLPGGLSCNSNLQPQYVLSIVICLIFLY